MPIDVSRVFIGNLFIDQIGQRHSRYWPFQTFFRLSDLDKKTKIRWNHFFGHFWGAFKKITGKGGRRGNGEKKIKKNQGEKKRKNLKKRSRLNFFIKKKSKILEVVIQLWGKFGRWKMNSRMRFFLENVNRPSTSLVCRECPQKFWGKLHRQISRYKKSGFQPKVQY